MTAQPDLLVTQNPGKPNPLKLKASDIRDAMKKKWVAQEWAILWEVNEGTGARVGRAADAVMMSLWPSRGLELHGVEIKVSRSDWKREAMDPTKAEAVAKYCDRWWVHTPTGIVQDPSEMPPAWGLREFDGKAWRTIREAEKTEAEPVNRLFLASLLRRSDGLVNSMVREARDAAYAEMEGRRAQMDKEFNERLERALERRMPGHERLKEQLAKFEEAFGVKVSEYSPDMEAIGHAAAAIAQCNDWNFRHNDFAEKFRNAAEAMEKIGAMIDGSWRDEALGVARKGQT